MFYFQQAEYLLIIYNSHLYRGFHKIIHIQWWLLLVAIINIALWQFQMVYICKFIHVTYLVLLYIGYCTYILCTLLSILLSFSFFQVSWHIWNSRILSGKKRLMTNNSWLLAQSSFCVREALSFGSLTPKELARELGAYLITSIKIDFVPQGLFSRFYRIGGSYSFLLVKDMILTDLHDEFSHFWVLGNF